MGRVLQMAAGLRIVLIAVFLSAGLASCVTQPEKTVAAAEASMPDPFVGLNKHIFAFNDAVDTALIRPAAYVYREATPRPIKGIVTNFLGHLTLPVTIINDLLQGKPDQAKIAFGRLFLNTVVGIGGLFDVATPAGFPMHREDMGQTFAVHGAEPGPYIVLPIIGPSSTRDVFGRIIDTVIDPVSIATYGSDAGQAFRIGRTVGDGLVTREQLIEPLDALRESIDYYAAVRSAYRQRRTKEILDGVPTPDAGEDDPFASFETEEKAPESGANR